MTKPTAYRRQKHSLVESRGYGDAATALRVLRQAAKSVFRVDRISHPPDSPLISTYFHQFQ